MSQYSHRVAGGISELCRSAQKLKGEGWEDPNDPNVIAEKELLNAAAAIEAAAAKLAQLKPRKEATSKVQQLKSYQNLIFVFRQMKISTLMNKSWRQQNQLLLRLNSSSNPHRPLRKN